MRKGAMQPTFIDECVMCLLKVSWVKAKCGNGAGTIKQDRTDVHDAGDHGRKLVPTDDLVQRMEQAIRGNSRFTISVLSDSFPEISSSLLYSIVSEILQYRKLYARWNNITNGCHLNISPALPWWRNSIVTGGRDIGSLRKSTNKREIQTLFPE